LVEELIIGGGLGYIIGRIRGKGGKVTVEVVYPPPGSQLIQKVDVPAHAEAYDMKEFNARGRFFHVYDPDGNVTVDTYIRFNEKDAPALRLDQFRRVRGPFYRFFITDPGVVDSYSLLVSETFEFFPSDISGGGAG
jgi:hypothetical protein